MQLVGYSIWQRANLHRAKSAFVSERDVTEGIALAEARFHDVVHEPAIQVICGLCGLHISRISQLKASSPTRARSFCDKPIQCRYWPLRATPLSRAATATKGYAHLAQLIGYSIWISSIPNRPRLPSAWARRPTRLALLGPSCFSRRTFRRRSEATCSLPHPIWMSI